MTVQCLIDLTGHILGWQIDDSADSQIGTGI